MKGQTVVICPQCGGNKVRSSEVVSKALMWFGVISCITIIGLPVGIILLVAAYIVKVSKMKLTFHCQECKHSFKVKEEKYNDYKSAIKSKEESVQG